MMLTRCLVNQTRILMPNVRIWNHFMVNNGGFACGITLW